MAHNSSAHGLWAKKDEIKESISCPEYLSERGFKLKKAADGCRCKSVIDPGDNETCAHVHQSWVYDHKAGWSGDIIELCAVLEHNGDRDAALRDLADRVGIKADEVEGDPTYKRQAEYRERLKADIERWHANLRPIDRDYLHGRRFTDKYINDMMIGYDGIRLVFPYRKNGSYVYYTSRACDYDGDPRHKIRDGYPKYKKAYLNGLNENPIWGMHTLNRESRPLVIAEGCVDTMAFDMQGFRVISGFGGDFASAQREQVIDICRDAGCVYLSFDWDDAGRGFTEKWGGRLFDAGVKFYVTRQPVPKDADRIVSRIAEVLGVKRTAEDAANNASVEQPEEPKVAADAQAASETATPAAPEAVKADDEAESPDTANGDAQPQLPETPGSLSDALAQAEEHNKSKAPKDVGDFFAAGGDLNELITDAEPGLIYLAWLVVKEKTRDDFAAFAIDAGTRYGKPEMDEMFDYVEAYAPNSDLYNKTWLKSIKRAATSVSELKVVREILSKHRLTHREGMGDHGFFEYNGKVWEQLGASKIRSLISKALGHFAKDKLVNSILGLLEAECPSLTDIRDPLDKDKPMEFNQTPVFVFRNGTLELETGNFREHRETDYWTTMAPYDYDPTAKCPLWDKVREQVSCNRPLIAKVINQWGAYVLFPDNRLHKSLVCVGDGANGKSVVLETYAAVFGESLTSHVELSQLANQFAPMGLYGRMLNISTETQSSVSGAEDVFKKITAGEPLSASYKFKDAIEWRSRVKMLNACNELPTTKDKTGGMRRRLFPVPFDARFSPTPRPDEYQADPTLINKLCAERPGIFNEFYAEYKPLMEANGFVEFPELQELTRKFMALNNNVVEFFDDSLRATLPSCISADYVGVWRVKEIYEQYTAWCDETGRSRYKATRKTCTITVRKQLEEMGFICDTKGNGAGDGRKLVFVPRPQVVTVQATTPHAEEPQPKALTAERGKQTISAPAATQPAQPPSNPELDAWKGVKVEIPAEYASVAPQQTPKSAPASSNPNNSSDSNHTPTEVQPLKPLEPHAKSPETAPKPSVAKAIEVTPGEYMLVKLVHDCEGKQVEDTKRLWLDAGVDDVIKYGRTLWGINRKAGFEAIHVDTGCSLNTASFHLKVGLERFKIVQQSVTSAKAPAKTLGDAYKQARAKQA